MFYPSIHSSSFQESCKKWIEEQGEILALFRFSHSAGDRDYEFFSDFSLLIKRIENSPPRTCVTVWGEPVLPMRGIVNDAFISNALISIPEDTAWLIVSLALTVMSKMSWHEHMEGEKLDHIKSEFPDFMNQRVAFGVHPKWSEHGGKEVSALVPEADGLLIVGIY